MRILSTIPLILTSFLIFEGSAVALKKITFPRCIHPDGYLFPCPITLPNCSGEGPNCVPPPPPNCSGCSPAAALDLMFEAGCDAIVEDDGTLDLDCSEALIEWQCSIHNTAVFCPKDIAEMATFICVDDFCYFY